MDKRTSSTRKSSCELLLQVVLSMHAHLTADGLAAASSQQAQANFKLAAAVIMAHSSTQICVQCKPTFVRATLG
jgi:hypothetical protein